MHSVKAASMKTDIYPDRNSGSSSNQIILSGKGTEKPWNFVPVWPTGRKNVAHHSWMRTVVHRVLCEGPVDVHQSSSSCMSCSSSWAFDNTAMTMTWKPSISPYLYHPHYFWYVLNNSSSEVLRHCSKSVKFCQFNIDEKLTQLFMSLTLTTLTWNQDWCYIWNSITHSICCTVF